MAEHQPRRLPSDTPPEWPRSRDEYVVLRETIRQRGTVRLVLPVVSIACWALLARDVTGPLSRVFPLLVLVAGFDAIAALHLNVERVGRYLQVFFEERGADQSSPQWETAVMSYGRQFPGSGADPLFSRLFVLATLVNAAPMALIDRPGRMTVLIALLHLIFILRIVVERRRSGRQRVEDLERFRTIAGGRPGATTP